jgi:hypothetical protein
VHEAASIPAMLERIALHQTRLRTPGLGVDGKGVALGAKGLVLLPSLERLVAWLAVYTRDRSLEDLIATLRITLVRSKLGTRELTLEFAAESSDRMDKIAETARLVGGFTFTGTSRHFVQYRDAAAPFGYDAGQLLGTDATLALYHDKFTQVYEPDKVLELRALLLRLMPHVDPSTLGEGGLRFIVAEQGLGPALIHYFVRSQVEAEVGIAEWPPESAFDEGPQRRYLFKVPNLPERMRNLLQATPGLCTFLPTGNGAGVEIGYRHPVALRACPVFATEGLVLLRGRGMDPLIIDQMPQLGDVRAFARVELLDLEHGFNSGKPAGTPPDVRVPLRIVASSAAWRNVTATWLTPQEVPLLRKLAYALPASTIAATRAAITAEGVFLRCSTGIEAIPLGTFFHEFHPQLFTPAGFEVSPSVAPEVLHRALRMPAGHIAFVTPSARAIVIAETAFVELETWLLESPPWKALEAEQIERALLEAPIMLTVGELGLLPMRGVVAPPQPQHVPAQLPAANPIPTQLPAGPPPDRGPPPPPGRPRSPQ